MYSHSWRLTLPINAPCDTVLVMNYKIESNKGRGWIMGLVRTIVIACVLMAFASLCKAQYGKPLAPAILTQPTLQPTVMRLPSLMTSPSNPTLLPPSTIIHQAPQAPGQPGNTMSLIIPTYSSPDQTQVQGQSSIMSLIIPITPPPGQAQNGQGQPSSLMSLIIPTVPSPNQTQAPQYQYSPNAQENSIPGYATPNVNLGNTVNLANTGINTGVNTNLPGLPGLPSAQGAPAQTWHPNQTGTPGGQTAPSGVFFYGVLKPSMLVNADLSLPNLTLAPLLLPNLMYSAPTAPQTNVAPQAQELLPSSILPLEGAAKQNKGLYQNPYLNNDLWLLY